MQRFFKSRYTIIAAGVIFGALSALMTNWGNPPNMGICVACFLRDIAGAIGIHRAGVVQFLRPEIMGFVFGSAASAFAFKEWKATGGSSPIIRFVLGAMVMIGALVFLGCPVRMLLRIAGGDLNGIVALAGMVAGIALGVFFLKTGFNLGRAVKVPKVAGWIMPLIMLGLLILAIIKPDFIFSSETGPGSQRVALIVALVVGLAVGVLAQRTRMCFVGGWRDLFLVRNFYLFSGVISFLLAALVTNYIVGNFAADGIYHWGFTGQPVAHTDHLWNFLGMSLLGLAATLLGGCPLRNLILSGEGNTDAGITVLGYLAGAAIAHNFLFASSGAGAGANGPIAVIVGLVFCILLGFGMREKTA